MTCAWCKMGFSGLGCTDRQNRVFCSPEHQHQYSLAHPELCDCGCKKPVQVILGTYRFASSACLIGFETVT